MADVRIPSHQQFCEFCTEEFGFLADFGFAETTSHLDSNKFVYTLSDGRFFVTVQGQNWGHHASTSLRERDGISVPIILFVPSGDREGISFSTTDFQQLDDIRTDAIILKNYCVSIFRGDVARFHRCEKEWRRISDPKFAPLVQDLRLP